MVLCGIQELLELGIGYGILVDIKRGDVHRVLVIAARNILPWILHVDASIVEAFDFEAFHLEEIIGGRNFRRAFKSSTSRLLLRNIYELLRKRLPLMRITGEWRCRHLFHL